MNKVFLVGRITKDPELRRTNSGIPFVRFTLAINRRYQNKSGEREADFISCIAWRQTAELLARYITKGSQIGVDGNIQTSSFDDQNGVRQFSTQVVCESIHFLDTRRQSNHDQGGYGQYANNYQSNNQYQDNYNSYQNENKEQKHENPFEDLNPDISNDDLPF